MKKMSLEKKKGEKCVGEPARATHVINYIRYPLWHPPIGILDSVSSPAHVPKARLHVRQPPAYTKESSSYLWPGSMPTNHCVN